MPKSTSSSPRWTQTHSETWVQRSTCAISSTTQRISASCSGDRIPREDGVILSPNRGDFSLVVCQHRLTWSYHQARPHHPFKIPSPQSHPTRLLSPMTLMVSIPIPPVIKTLMMILISLMMILPRSMLICELHHVPSFTLLHPSSYLPTCSFLSSHGHLLLFDPSLSVHGVSFVLCVFPLPLCNSTIFLCLTCNRLSVCLSV